MNSFDDIFEGHISQRGQTNQPFDKEAWAEKKQAERQSVYDLADTAAVKVGTDGSKFQSYLDVQTRFSRYSATNVLLILAQKPEATQLKDFNGWKEAGASIKRQQKGISILEPGEEYERADGSIGTSYNVKRVFDISQTTARAMEMLRAAEVREDDDCYQSPLDELFERLEMKNPDHIAVKYYKDYHSGSAKTLKSIQITLAARLEKFNLSSLAALTATDELDLPSLGEKKVALFALIPDNDTSFNFLVSILYTQIFQQLFWLADHKYGGSLPVPVHFLMDEFANVSLPDDFDKILATMRSRNVSVTIILQNIAQLKALFEKQWESILGNCDEMLYLGGNETSTHKLISESYLGKSTIDTNTYGKSSGRSGNYSTNYQITGRELMTPDEVRMMDNRYALLFIRGERPIMDEKYNPLKHPNVALTALGGAPSYEHGKTDHVTATISIGAVTGAEPPESESIADETMELLSNEEIEALFHLNQ